MSLINDALKRASRSDKAQPPRVESGTYGSMFPVQEKKKPKFPWGIVIVVVAAVVLSAVFFAKWWGASHQPAPVVKAPVIAPKPKPEPAPVPEIVKEVAPAPATKPADTAQNSPPAAVTNAAPEPEQPSNTVAAASLEPWPADLHLKGIFYSKTTPHALISGKTVAVGEEISGIHIIAIDPNSVTIEWKGQTKTLYTD